MFGLVHNTALDETPFVFVSPEREVDDRDCGGNLPMAILKELQNHVDGQRAFLDKVTKAFRDANLID